jgi:hypothetical protein
LEELKWWKELHNSSPSPNLAQCMCLFSKITKYRTLSSKEWQFASPLPFKVSPKLEFQGHSIRGQKILPWLIVVFLLKYYPLFMYLSYFSNFFMDQRFWEIVGIVGCMFLLQIYLWSKVVCLFCFVLMRSTKLGCFKSCSWSLWKALEEEGCMGLVSWRLDLHSKSSWILNDFFTKNWIKS